MPGSKAGSTSGSERYGLIGRLVATPGRRQELAAALLEGSEDLPGCESYVVAEDPTDEDALWVTEVWRDREAHATSLSLPQVQAAIARGRPVIAAFDVHHETRPLGRPADASGTGQRDGESGRE